MTPWRVRLFKTRRVLKMSARALGRRKLRAALSTLGVVCGVAAVFSMICVGEGARRQAMRSIESLGMKNILVKSKDLTEEQ